MTPEVRRRLDKADRLLAIARRYDPFGDPDGVAHHAYYAMLNAAVAVLLAHTGRAPKMHGTVVSEFGRLVRDIDDAARTHNRHFRRAQDLRLLADYDPDAEGLGPRAADALERAHVFVEFCRSMAVPSTT